MKILVTGVAGFIGAALARRLLARGDEVIGLDNLNDYYDVRLKTDRLAQLEAEQNFHFTRLDISERAPMAAFFSEHRPERVVHLAAQAGVRYSLQNPHAYVDANLTGFVNVLEACRHNNVEHLVYASSSSVYGANANPPFAESDCAAQPVSLYGATKRANELMGHSYSHLFAIPMTALRYFTVYGPWGRPDMSPTLFAGKIYAGERIQLFNHGEHERDFTFIDDAVAATVKIIDQPPAPAPASDTARHRIYNVGNQHAVGLSQYIQTLEDEIGKKALLEYTGPQAGDVVKTLADSSRLARELGFKARVSLQAGIKKFIQWYKPYYKVADVTP